MMLHLTTRLRSLLACCVAVLLACSAARPFEDVSLDSPAYTDFATVSAAGLLSGYDLPLNPISRLEAAVLTSRALNAYADSLLAGADRDAVVEDALENLSLQFEEELAQVGSGQRAVTFDDIEPGADVDSGDPNVYASRYTNQPAADDKAPVKCGRGSGEGACKISPEEEALQVEEEVEEEEPAAEEEPPAPEEPAVEVQMYGCLNTQLQLSDTSLTGAGSESRSNVDIYYGELGWDAGFEDWTAHFSVNLNDEDGSVDLYEAFAGYHEADSGATFVLGRFIMPFGNNFFYSPTYPSANDLGATTVNGIGVGTEQGSWALGGYLYKPGVEVDGANSGLTEYSVVWDISKREASEAGPGWRLSAGYNTDMAAHDLRLAGDGPLGHTVADWNLFGKYDWAPTCCSPRGSWHILADYIAALDEYDPADLDANGDGIGDKPSALNIELVHEPVEDQLFGITYQSSRQMADAAETRWGLLYGERINKLVMLKLLASHGEFGDYATGSQKSDNSFVGELCLGF